MLRTERQRAVLSFAIRRAQSGDQTPKYLSADLQRMIEIGYLPSLREQADNLTRWIGDTAEGPGEGIDVNFRDHGAVIGTLLKAEAFRFLVEEMIKSGEIVGTFSALQYTKPDSGTTTQGHAAARIYLSFSGSNRYEELRRGAAESRIAFMAMQYGDQELDQIVANHFRHAVSDVGFTLRWLDDYPRAGLIDDRLRVEIRGCRFMIADLSHGNRGAHWEAGFAEGLGKPVIYTCRKNVFEDKSHVQHPHFDTNHHLTVSWDPLNIRDACSRLKATIRATLPDAKQTD